MNQNSSSVLAHRETTKSPSSEQTGHTPGPWEDDVDNINAKAIAPYIKVNSEHEGIACVFGRTPTERRANARLVSAAPELLIIAREIANSGCDLGDSERRIRLYSAIQKAGGEL